MRNVDFLAVVLSTLLLAACAGPRGVNDESIAPRPAPLPLGEGGSHPMIFQKVVYRIPAGTILGETRLRRHVIDEIRWNRSATDTAEFNVAVTDAFRALGYDMRDGADALFDPGKVVKVRYELAAILHDADLDFQYELDRKTYRTAEGVGQAHVELEVQLRDSTRGETVYSRRFEGSGTDSGREPNPMVKAVVDAILLSATDEEFVGRLRKDGGPSASPGDGERTLVAVCPADRELSLPADMQQVIESVVEVRVGGVVGTGVVISEDGWILSAHHVVSDAEEVRVRLRSGIELPARVHKSRNRADVALLKLEGRGFACSRPRRATEDLAIGVDVFGVNAAVGEGGLASVTKGVVAGYGESNGRRFLQTDASVNPGSSGGPVFTVDGRVSAITTAKLVGIGIEGVGFAVPIDDALRALDVVFTGGD